MAGQYYLDKIDISKDAVSIPGKSMTYVLNKSLEKNQKAWVIVTKGEFVTYVEINEKSSSTVVVMAPWIVVVIVKNVS